MHFNLVTTFMLTIYCNKLVTINCEEGQYWDNHVYTGRHFDDYVTATTQGPPNVIIPALLILYNSRCEVNIRFLKSEKLPPQHQFLVAKHDYERYPSWIWYKLDERDDLVKRYKPIRYCPEFLFFKNGTTLDKFERYIESRDRNVISWLSKQLTVTFSITNKMPRPIKVHFDTSTDHRENMVLINPGITMEISSYMSNIMYVAEKTRIVYASVIDSSIPDNIVIRKTKAEDIDIVKWLKKAKLDSNRRASHVRNWRHGIASLYLLNFKQPAVLPKFTSQGYKKDFIPVALYDELFKFYLNNVESRVPEENQVEPAINDSEVKCTMVLLDEERKNRIDEVMRPILETWCNCSLEPTRTYGVREYYQGNILRNHVDRIETHVISVIFQIHKNLGHFRDWPLQVIDYQGNQKSIFLDSGEMLLYESATLIHGRPTPFYGHLFANVFIHYKPVTGWTWRTSQSHIVKDGKKYEPLNRMAPLSVTHAKSLMFHEEL